MIVTGEPVARFVSGRLGFALCPPYTAIGLEKDGMAMCGVLFNQFEGANIHFTAAGTGWTRAFLREVGRYVFDQLGCERATATTELADVVDLALRLGGKIEGRMRNHFGAGRDGVIVGILRDEYRFHRPLECVGAFG